ncbi:hypothetical protein ACTFIW_010579 [Dictyostelium discoideum]
MDEDISNDPKNKHFNEDINSVLLQFSKSTEWADFVKCLAKFAKVFEKYPKSTYIQNKLMVSKRLSQCLNPSLPSGCHMKALETYELIFSRIGQERLSKDIAIYATGLFPLFHLASTDVRVKIVSLYERHILTLGLRLISCLNGVVSSILPGLEEGQGEAFEQVKKLLDGLCQSTSTTLFYQALWKTLITTPYNRLATLNYLLLRLPKNVDASNQIMYLPEKDTLVTQAITNSLSDKSILVQRNILELITVNFSLNGNVFSAEATETIVKSAIMVVTNKDMSLNKRLYTWLLGDSDSTHTRSYDPKYFENYAKQPTVNALKSFFRNTLEFFEYLEQQALLDSSLSSSSSQQTQQTQQQIQQTQQSQQTQQTQQQQQQQNCNIDSNGTTQVVVTYFGSTLNSGIGSNEIILPFKILIFFFQKEEFQTIIKDILPDILKYIFTFKDGYSFSKDVIKYTDDLLETISDHSAIWELFSQLLECGTNGKMSSIESVKLVECILDIMPLSTEEVQLNYLPSLLKTMINSMFHIVEIQDHQLIIQYTQLLLKITGKIIVDSPSSLNFLVTAIDSYQDYFLKISDYVQKQLQLQQVQQQQPSQPQQQQQVQQQQVSQQFNISTSSPQQFSLSSGNNSNSNNNNNNNSMNSIYFANSDIFVILDLSFQMLVGLISQFKGGQSNVGLSTSPQQSSPTLESAPKWFYPVFGFCESENPFISCLAIKTFISLANKHGDMVMSRSFKNIITPDHFHGLAKKLWSLLDPIYSAIHYRVASLFILLRELNEEGTSSVIADAMLDSNLINRTEGYQKFALLWRLTGELGNSSLPFSNTLFLMLDSLSNDQPIIRLTGHTWLADSISRAERILDPLLKILLDKSTIRFNNTYQTIYDTRRVIYVFKILKTIIECDFKLFIQHVIEKPISKDVISLNDLQTSSFRESSNIKYTTSNNTNNNQINNNQINNNNNNNNNQINNTYSGFSSGNNKLNNNNNINNNNSNITTETSSDFLFIPTNSYIDLLVVVSLRFIQGQVGSIANHQTSDSKTFVSQNEVVQICAAEFLQFLLVKTSIQPIKAQEIAQSIQDPILQNLAQAVSTSNMVLQVHLLSLLRSIVLIDSSNNNNSQSSSNNSVNSSPTLSLSPGGGGANENGSNINNINNNGNNGNQLNNSLGVTSLTSITQSQMFLQTTVVGLIQPSTRFNIRFYWLDFITFCLPRMSNSSNLSSVVTTIVNCLRDILGSFDSRSLYDSLTSRDIIVILKSLTYIFNISILEPITSFDNSGQDGTDHHGHHHGHHHHHGGNSGSGSTSRSSALGVKIFTDFVKDVFTSDIDNLVSLTPIGHVRKDIFNVLADIFQPFLKIWGQPKSSTSSKISMSTDVSSDTHNKFAIQDLIIHILDPFMTKYPQQFIEAIVELWQRNEVTSTTPLTSSISNNNLSGISSYGGGSGGSGSGGSSGNVGLISKEQEAIQNRKVIMEIINSLEPVKEESLFNAAYQILTNIRLQEKAKPPKNIVHKLTMKESSLYDFVFRFIEEYSTQFDGVSSSFLSFVRESLHSSNPMTFVSQLSIINTYVKKLTPDEKTKNLMRSKINKRELQELLPKIIEPCFLISGKGFSDISTLYIPPTTNSNAPQQIATTTSTTTSTTTTTSTSQDSNLNNNNNSSNTPTLSGNSSPLSLGSQQQSSPQPSSQQQPSQPPQQTQRPISMDLRAFSEGGYIPSQYTSSSTSIVEDSNVNSNNSNNSNNNNNNNLRNRSSSGGESESTLIAPTKLKKEANRLKSHVSLKALIALSTLLAPLLDSVFDDKEKIATILANSLHCLVPYLKSKTDINRENNTYYTTCLFASLSEYPYNLKSIKKDVIELFYDQELFKSDLRTLEQASKFINSTMICDKTALSDFTKVLHKPWTTTTTMFTSKDTENLNRSKQLKRLSFIIWCGNENQYLSILPLVQEKIVEALKIPNAVPLHLQVFFCLRVLLIKISHQNLRSFWPIIITELIEILSNSDQSELVLAACKFLDLALTLPTITEQFNLFEWVFVKDCFVKHSQEPPFLPFVDQISKRLNNTTTTATTTTSTSTSSPSPSPSPSTQQSNNNNNNNNVNFQETQLVLTSSGIVETQLFEAPYLRPCILIRNINELPGGFNEFKSFLAHFSNCIYSRHLQSARKSVDYKFINELLCFDFCELEPSKLYSTPESTLAFEKKQYHAKQIQLQLLQQKKENDENISKNWLKSVLQNNNSPRSRAISISREKDQTDKSSDE